jgi:hypothetical protein
MITDYIDFSFRQYFIVVNSQNGIKRLEDGPKIMWKQKKKSNLDKIGQVYKLP